MSKILKSQSSYLTRLLPYLFSCRSAPSCLGELSFKAAVHLGVQKQLHLNDNTELTCKELASEQLLHAVPHVSTVNLKKLYPRGSVDPNAATITIRSGDQKIVGCRWSNFLKHDALLLHWLNYFLYIYIYILTSWTLQRAIPCFALTSLIEFERIKNMHLCSFLNWNCAQYHYHYSQHLKCRD